MNAREVALRCLLTLAQTDTSIASVVDDAFETFSINERERRLANALVYGVVRWQQQLDWVLKQVVNPRFELNDRHRAILRLGAFQILHLDGIPVHAAIFETVQLTKGNRKTVGFVNAVLRSIQRKASDLTFPSIKTHPIDHISISLSYPKWLVKRWMDERGLDWTLAFCKASNQIATHTLRVNTLRTAREKLIRSLQDSGISTKLSKFAPEGILLDNSSNSTNRKTLKSIVTSNDVYFQDESAMLIPHLLKPESMELVVDLCSAPGGKTTHIASLMRDTGKVIASDISDKKLEMLLKNCKRLGVQNIETQKVDAAKEDLSFIFAADAVLIDAPCSGFGTLRRHPNILWHKTSNQLAGLRGLQYSLLKNAAPYIKPEGVLIYSTCTIEPTENEDIIKRFLIDFPNFTVENANQFLPDIPKSMITSQGYLQTFPHEHGIDGSFAARLRRVA